MFEGVAGGAWRLAEGRTRRDRQSSWHGKVWETSRAVLATEYKQDLKDETARAHLNAQYVLRVASLLPVALRQGGLDRRLYVVHQIILYLRK